MCDDNDQDDLTDYVMSFFAMVFLMLLVCTAGTILLTWPYLVISFFVVMCIMHLFMPDDEEDE